MYSFKKKKKKWLVTKIVNYIDRDGIESSMNESSKWMYESNGKKFLAGVFCSSVLVNYILIFISRLQNTKFP